MGDRLLLLGGVILSAAFGWAALIAPPQTPSAREDYNSGAYLYRAFCASCHGERGKGDGPVADLTDPRTPDITILQRQAKGVFPRAHVLGVLDGSIPLKGHAGPAMPDWSRVLRKTEGEDERIVRQRMEAMVSHVESLQEK